MQYEGSSVTLTCFGMANWFKNGWNVIMIKDHVLANNTAFITSVGLYDLSQRTVARTTVIKIL